MMQYTDTYWNVLLLASKGWLNRKYGRAYVSQLLPKAKAEYRRLLAVADDIGGTRNSMAKNLYLCLVYAALWKAADGHITEQDLRDLTKAVMSLPPVKLMYASMNMNNPSGVKRVSDMLHRPARWLEEHPQYQHLSWDFHFDETKHRDGLYYHFTQCPINTLARREGFLEILPVMCDVDHITAKLMHAVLHREHTLATGGAVCDYWFVGDKIKDPR